MVIAMMMLNHQGHHTTRVKNDLQMQNAKIAIIQSLIRLETHLPVVTVMTMVMVMIDEVERIRVIEVTRKRLDSAMIQALKMIQKLKPKKQVNYLVVG